MENSIAGPLALFGAAFIWGVAFVFQVEGMDHVPPVTFMAARCLLAAIFLGILVAVIRGPKEVFRFDRATLLGGIGCGLAVKAEEGKGIRNTDLVY